MATRIPELLSSYTMQIHRVPKLIRNSIQEQYKIIIKTVKQILKRCGKRLTESLTKIRNLQCFPASAKMGKS